MCCRMLTRRVVWLGMTASKPEAGAATLLPLVRLPIPHRAHVALEDFSVAPINSCNRHMLNVARS